MHLAASIRDQPRASIEELNAVATLRLVRAAERAGRAALPVLLGDGRRATTRARASSARRRSRRRPCEASPLETMVFAPSIVYTPGDPWLTLLERFSYLPALPVSGSGRAALPADLGRGRGRLRAWRALLATARAGELRARRPRDALLRRHRARGARGERAAAGGCCTCRSRWCGPRCERSRRVAGPKVFATWEEAELMEEPMTTARGTADARRSACDPAAMAAVLGTARTTRARRNAGPSRRLRARCRWLHHSVHAAHAARHSAAAAVLLRASRR